MPFNSFENYPMSWKPSIDKTEKPIYKALAGKLEQDILDGVLLPGTKLPPQRELADYLDLNVSTISKAFKVCELKGLLSATVGSGTFVSYDALSNAYLLEDTKPKHLIEMGATLPDNASYEPLLLQLKSMVQETDYEKWFSYGRAGESLWQKDAAVKLIRRGGFETAVDRILFANGGQNAIAATLASLCKPGDRIGVDHHTYPGLKTVAAMLSVQIVPIKSENDEMSPESLEYACKNENIKGIYLIPDYHNPTASFMSVENRRMIADIAKKYNLFVIEDASYHLLGKNPLPALASFAPEQVIHIASLSKSLAPGLRLAYVAVPGQFKEPISKALYNLNITVSPLLSELTARTIVSNQFEVLIEGHREQTIRRNQIVNRYFAEYTCLGVETGIFRWLLLPGKMTGAEFEKLAAQHGVQVYAAERFVVGNSRPERAVRVSVCAPKTLEELERGLMILTRLLNDLT
ncbi:MULTISPECIES: PLP-dependent aminotransferase family protein [Bacillus]|uniref:PLP-dependent aminotransferase family protein n=1 Tax=Bacillus glycinifermentans TaxID=1664069 RepID=A0AAJ3YZA5_9BACI|nr:MULTISPECIES: PLP-dependent aminotransferase family protein [Bacillus]KKB74666.1 GntR family transcriptional regulator [Bacillus sp. TH008]MDU0070985.1 PLP-dependent aminotransferase family protein [Bacillus sp. IG6]MED8018852.1 PLP-dependent aminotransferase family protein [Bacillus glycinifermentans]QAT65916.1 PLP-dependent aminotransferase family protein [Bacillus glycinifermentans]WKB75618.1 PLP-dependent aminotransferase family protein [Bacillus glycinifermentans]